MRLELGLCWSMACGVREFIPSDRAKMGEGTLPLKLFRSFWNSKCRYQQRNAKNGMECTDEADQTSKTAAHGKNLRIISLGYRKIKP